jgi:UDP-perosamine 4-acetyltransferase
MKKVVVIGGGGHAKVVIDMLLVTGWSVVGYTDPNPVAGVEIAGVPCLGDDEALAGLAAAGIAWAHIALGDNRQRSRLAEHAAGLGFGLANAVHPSAQISSLARLGQGVAIMPCAVVNAGSTIGDTTILNTAATVDHDCTLGRSVHIAPGAHLAGYVTVEDEALVGLGAAVVRDVPPGTTVAGNPARLYGRRKSKDG